MLNEALPPLTQRELDHTYGLGMYWAFTHLAYYADNAFPARTTLSFQRSYGPDSITRFPRAVNGTPGFIVAKWVAPKVPRTLIAMEGTREWNQILVWSASTTNVVEPNPGEWVLQTFRDYANNVQQSLTTGGIWTNPFMHSSEPIDFAGHSLGAAICEILADRVARQFPGKPVSLVKFGAPRVGSHGWVLNRAPMQNRRSIYADNDPIDFIPRYAFARNAGAINPTVLDSGFLFREASFVVYDRLGQLIRQRTQDTMQNAIVVLLNLNRSITTDNPWYWHHRNAYRLVLCELFATGNHFNKLRLQHIELPDENTFGANFRPGRGLQADMLNIIAPPPANVLTGYVPPPPPTPTQADNIPTPQPITGLGLDNVNRGQFGPTPRQHRGHMQPQP